MSNKPNPSESVPYFHDIRAAIVRRHGTVKAWIDKRKFAPAPVYRIINRKHGFVYSDSTSGNVIRALEEEFGLTPEQIGVTVLEVGR